MLLQNIQTHTHFIIVACHKQTRYAWQKQGKILNIHIYLLLKGPNAHANNIKQHTILICLNDGLIALFASFWIGQNHFQTDVSVGRQVSNHMTRRYNKEREKKTLVKTRSEAENQEESQHQCPHP